MKMRRFADYIALRLTSSNPVEEPGMKVNTFYPVDCKRVVKRGLRVSMMKRLYFK